VDLGGTVRVGGITIRAGELMHADANGVCTIPAEIADQVADAAVEFVAAEALVLDYLKSGKPEPKAFAQARAAMMDAIGALGRRVRA
jgi:regulator of RNase E activity RraA